MRSLLVAFALGAALLAAGCGSSPSSGAQAPSPNAQESSPAGDIPDNQAYVAYTARGGGVTVKIPEGWSRITAAGATTFTDKLNAITVQTASAHAPVTAAQARAIEVPKLARSVKGFKTGPITEVTRKSGSAVRITYLAMGKPDPVTGKSRTNAFERYLFFHHGIALTLTLSGPKGADNVDPWRIVTDSVRWTA